MGGGFAAAAYTKKGYHSAMAKMTRKEAREEAFRLLFETEFRNDEDPAEIFEFIERFRKDDPATPIVLVPTSFNSVKEEEWKARGANIVIYANQLMRAAVPAIRKAAETILENHRAEECDKDLMPFKDIIRLIPEE